MKNASSFRKTRRGLLAAALTVCAPTIVYAIDFVSTDFNSLAAKAEKSSPMDYSGYEKLNLSVLGDTAWVPKTRGAMGPMRTETLDPAAAAQEEARDRDLQMHLGPIGGRNTF